MINSSLTKVIGSKNDRMLKRLGTLVQTINGLEPEIQALSDEQLRGAVVTAAMAPGINSYVFANMYARQHNCTRT